MGRPPGVKNGSHGAKNGSKAAAAGGGGGKNLGRACNNSSSTTAASGGGGDKDKATQDRSQSNFPYDIRLNGYTSLHNAVQKGTPRIKRILLDECDFIMECRVCRNLFRSLPNFITHKLNYCKKAFDSTWCLGLSNLIPSGDSATTSSFNIEYEVDPELVLINAATNLSSSNDTSNTSITEPEPSTSTRTRSVADLYNELAERTNAQKEKLRSQASSSDTSSPTSSSTSNNSNDKSNVIRLQLKPLVIPDEDGTSNGSTSTVVTGGGMKSVIVQQRVMSNDPSCCDNVCMKPREIVRKDTAILGPDGKVLCTAPGKGIEQVVSRLTAQLKALEEKEAQKMAALAKSTIICDVCKTVFDSDKALRQHKRESLDCGKIWGFKSPIHDKLVSAKSPASSSTLIPSKHSSGEGSEAHRSRAPAIHNPANETSQSIRQYRFISPPKGRRPSHHPHPLTNGVLISPSKGKRSMALSPVKRIKMKYNKLDSNSSSREFDAGRRPGTSANISTYSCSRCSASFTTRHEMSMHLALCTGSINFALLRESEPPQEKIRISLRNDFPKTATQLSPLLCASPPSVKTILSESHLKLMNRQRQMSGTSSSRGDTPTEEVNNNKHFKNNYQQQTSSGVSASSSSEEDEVPVAAFEPLEGFSTQRQTEEEIDSDITSHDSGVSSASSTKRKTKLLSAGAGKKAKVIKNSSSTSPAASKPTKQKKMGGGGNGGMMSERQAEAKKTVRKAVTTTTKVKPRSMAFNLRKCINSRIRKSRRNLRPPPPPQQQQQQQRQQKQLLT